MTDRFSICLPYVLAQECPFPEDWSNPKNFSDDSHDPGGATMCGITQREYDICRKMAAQPCRDVRLCTEQEGHGIYFANYWLPHCPALPMGLDLQFFDAAVNEGTTEAVKILQCALGIKNDGYWGRQTAGTVARIVDVKSIIQKFIDRRAEVYKLMKGYPYFGKGWERRTAEIGSAAMKMVA